MPDLNWNEEDTKAVLIGLFVGMVTAVLISVVIRRG